MNERYCDDYMVQSLNFFKLPEWDRSFHRLKNYTDQTNFDKSLHLSCFEHWYQVGQAKEK